MPSSRSCSPPRWSSGSAPIAAMPSPGPRRPRRERRDRGRRKGMGERRVKQILQSARDGALELAEVPAPTAGPRQVLVRTPFSVGSPGTDAVAVSLAGSSLLVKARSRPDLVRQVARKLCQEGPVSTWQAVTTRLEAPQPLGYSCAGVVEAAGEGVEGFAPGDRVACAGAGYANHAEGNAGPENRVARAPGR